MEEQVVLVDARDNEIGVASKSSVHRDGVLHRAISVFVFNSLGDLLLQRRAAGKYHSAGLWSNTCCSHPRPGERPHAAAIRRLEEEMGLRLPLTYAFSFLYRAELGDGVCEHELDHVFVGATDRAPEPEPEEVVEWRWASPSAVETELREEPEAFTAWFPLAYGQLRDRGFTSPAAVRRDADG